MRFSNPELEIDLAALCANYRLLAAGAPGAEAAAVVKCDAYGLGAQAVATTLEAREGCRIFFTAYPEEGAALRPLLKNSEAEIFVFNGPFDEYLDLFENYRLTPVINTLSQAIAWAGKYPDAAAALHIDTGMNRLGVSASQSKKFRNIGGLKIDTVISHLACASDPDDKKNEEQRKLFDTAAAAFPKARRSISATGGALIGGAFNFDMVRLGVGLYGASAQDEPSLMLNDVARLTAPVIQIRDIAPGETVGYGASFKAEREMRLATVALGYGDGFPRFSCTEREAVVGGVRRRFVGRVSMDLIVLDVTAGPSVEIGDRAEFFGPDLNIDEAAAACGTIGYELLTVIGGLTQRRSLGERVRRRYLWNGAPIESLPGAL